MAVAVFVSQSSREGPLTAVTARGGRGITRFPLVSGIAFGDPVVATFLEFLLQTVNAALSA